MSSKHFTPQKALNMLRVLPTLAFPLSGDFKAQQILVAVPTGQPFWSPEENWGNTSSNDSSLCFIPEERAQKYLATARDSFASQRQPSRVTAGCPEGSHYFRGHSSNITTECEEQQSLQAPELQSTYVVVWMTSSSGKLQREMKF